MENSARTIGLLCSLALVLASPTANAATASSCHTVGKQRVAVLIVTYPGAVEPTAHVDYIRELIEGTPDMPTPSLKDYFATLSEGKATIDQVDYFGPYTLSSPLVFDPSHGAPNGRGYSEMVQTLYSVAQDKIDLNAYDRIVFFSPSLLDAKTLKPFSIGAGMASLGCTQQLKSSKLTKEMGTAWILSLVGYAGILPSQLLGGGDFNTLPKDEQIKIIRQRKLNDLSHLIHELGHTFGLGHTNQVLRPWAPFVNSHAVQEVLPDEKTPIPLNYYQDYYSAMGSSTSGWYNAIQMQFLSWLAPAQVEDVKVSGTYRVYALEGAGNATKAITVPRLKHAGDNTRAKFWIEYRNGESTYEKDNGVWGTLNHQGALIHYANPDQPSASGDFNWPTDTIQLSFLPDGKTGSMLDQQQDGVLSGSWRDPHSTVNFQIQKVTPDYLEIHVGLLGQ